MFSSSRFSIKITFVHCVFDSEKVDTQKQSLSTRLWIFSSFSLFIAFILNYKACIYDGFHWILYIRDLEFVLLFVFPSIFVDIDVNANLVCIFLDVLTYQIC